MTTSLAQPPQPPLRTRHSLARKIVIDLTIMTAIGVILAFIGPFGSFEEPLGYRLVSWVGFSWIGYAIYSPMGPLVDRVAGALDLGRACDQLLFMQSNGGLTEAQAFQGKDAILSGPAGGIVGMAATGEEAGFDRLIGFDMGGTSTDVSHYAGEYERSFDTEVAGVRMRAPMMDIHTVAAGVRTFDGIPRGR